MSLKNEPTNYFGPFIHLTKIICVVVHYNQQSSPQRELQDYKHWKE